MSHDTTDTDKKLKFFGFFISFFSMCGFFFIILVISFISAEKKRKVIFYLRYVTCEHGEHIFDYKNRHLITANN